MGAELILPELGEPHGDSAAHERAWLDAVNIRVAELLDTDPGLLFSHLYRLDISEASLARILRTEFPKDIPEAISREILLREKQKAASRKANPRNIILDEEY
ncbi:MAG: hypothetical protein KBF37_00310 [Saprospiraceae bacterium]|nr:hypothetical protein [Saprospiraceae bacterium]MBP9208736.1 hypothetical protein [Saprospiraceae bacterium]MBV6472296.1 hypothetical protein [Saprospiraceae bacterium]